MLTLWQLNMDRNEPGNRVRTEQSYFKKQRFNKWIHVNEKSLALEEGNWAISHTCFGLMTLFWHLITITSFSAEPLFWPQVHTSRSIVPGYPLPGSIINMGLCSKLVTLLFIPQWVLTKYTDWEFSAVPSLLYSEMFHVIPCHFLHVQVI